MMPAIGTEGQLTVEECHRRLCRNIPQLRDVKYQDIVKPAADAINTAAWMTSIDNKTVFSSLSFTAVKCLSKFKCIHAIIKVQNEILKDFDLGMQIIPITMKNYSKEEFNKLKADTDARMQEIVDLIDYGIENETGNCDRLEELIAAPQPRVSLFVGKTEDIHRHLYEKAEYKEEPEYVIQSGAYTDILRALNTNFFSLSPSTPYSALNIDSFVAQLHQLLPLFITDYSKVKDLYD